MEWNSGILFALALPWTSNSEGLWASKGGRKILQVFCGNSGVQSFLMEVTASLELF